MKLREFGANQRIRSKRSKKTRSRILDKFHRRCWYCGKQLKRKSFRLEHQQPFSKGGSCKVGENVVVACVPCDTEKGNKNVEDFRKYLQKKTGVDVIEFFAERVRLP